MAVFPNGVVLLYDVDGNALAVQDGSAVAATTPGVYLLGSDGANARRLKLDVSGNQYVRQLSGDSTSYMASTNGAVSSGTSAGTVTSIAYLWHPAINTKNIEILEIDVSFGGGAGVGTNLGAVAVRGAFISAENGTPGGTSQAINAVNRGDAASTLTFRTGANAPTRVAGDLIAWASAGDGTSGFNFKPPPSAKPIQLRSGVAEGFEIRTSIEIALSIAERVAVTFYWKES